MRSFGSCWSSWGSKGKIISMTKRTIQILIGLLLVGILGIGVMIWVVSTIGNTGCCTCLDCPECDVCCDCDNPYINK